jgi:hypothetical protein
LNLEAGGTRHRQAMLIDPFDSKIVATLDPRVGQTDAISPLPTID